MLRTFARPVAVAVLSAAVTALTPLAADAGPRTAAPRVKVTPPRPTRYVVVGTLSAVDPAASSITLSPTTGGNAKVRPAPVTLTVPATARVSRDGVAVTLAELVAGDHVAASGTRSGTAVTLSKVVATSPVPEVVEPVV